MWHLGHESNFRGSLIRLHPSSEKFPQNNFKGARTILLRRSQTDLILNWDQIDNFGENAKNPEVSLKLDMFDCSLAEEFGAASIRLIESSTKYLKPFRSQRAISKLFSNRICKKRVFWYFWQSTAWRQLLRKRLRLTRKWCNANELNKERLLLDFRIFTEIPSDRRIYFF